MPPAEPHPLTHSPVHPLTDERRDVVVIGAGLAGSSIAAALAQLGFLFAAGSEQQERKQKGEPAH